MITELIHQRQRISASQLNQLIKQASKASFTPHFLQVDEALWGSFWQFDVIGPGYTLPAAELALLRATRLDTHWPANTTLTTYLADLQQTIQHPQAGIWSLPTAVAPCVIFAAPHSTTVTMVWYCITTQHIHTGYRVTHYPDLFKQATLQKQPLFDFSFQTEAVETNQWIASTFEQAEQSPSNNLTAQLDAAILRWRLGHNTIEVNLI